MTRGDFDRAVAELARKQHGCLNHRQATQLGGTDTMIADRLRAARWVRLARGVYALSGHPPTWRRQYKAAELSKLGSAIAGRPAGLVHSFEGFRVLRPKLVVPRGISPRSSIADISTCANIDAVVVDGLRVTTVAQTLLDVLNDCRLHKVERAMDGALLEGRLRLEDCEARLEAWAGTTYRHLGTYRSLVEDRRADGWAPPESELEAMLAKVLGRLPLAVEVRRQAGLPWWPMGAGRVDFLLPSWRLIVEADGRRWHARVADFDHDRWRDAVANAHGHRVLRFSHTHLTQRPDEVFDLVVAAGRWRTVAA